MLISCGITNSPGLPTVQSTDTNEAGCSECHKVPQPSTSSGSNIRRDRPHRKHAAPTLVLSTLFFQTWASDSQLSLKSENKAQNPFKTPHFDNAFQTRISKWFINTSDLRSRAGCTLIDLWLFLVHRGFILILNERGSDTHLKTYRKYAKYPLPNSETVGKLRQDDCPGNFPIFRLPRPCY